MVLLQEWREKHEFGEVESGKGKHTHKINTAEQKRPLPGQSDLEWLLFSLFLPQSGTPPDCFRSKSPVIGSLLMGFLTREQTKKPVNRIEQTSGSLAAGSVPLHGVAHL